MVRLLVHFQERGVNFDIGGFVKRPPIDIKMPIGEELATGVESLYGRSLVFTTLDVDLLQNGYKCHI
jgi:hypothetical protein